jgi:hypothetical protein
MQRIYRFIFDAAFWTYDKVVEVMKEAGYPGAIVEWNSEEQEAIRATIEPTVVSKEFLEGLKEGVEVVYEVDPLADPMSTYNEIDNALAIRMTAVPVRQADGMIVIVPIIRKTFAAVIEKDVGDGDTGKLGLTITTDEPDRYGDIIPADLWEFENYMRNPIVLFNHEYGVVANHPPSQGKTLKITAKKHSVKTIVEFHRKTEFNEELYQMYRGGYMNADSVGFGTTSKPELRVTDEGESIGLLFTGQELFEHSLVAVGANAGALQDAATKGLIRKTTRDYLVSLSPNAGTTRSGAAGKSPEKAARDEREILVRVFKTRAQLNAIETLRRLK